MELSEEWEVCLTLDLFLVVLKFWARPEGLYQDLDYVLALLVVIIALINLEFLGLNGENGDLVALLDREASFVCLGKKEDEVGILGERLRHLEPLNVPELVLDLNKLPLVVAVEQDLSIVQLGHNECEAIVVTILVILDELPANHQLQIIVNKVVDILLHDDLNLSIFEHHADIKAARAIYGSEYLNDCVLKNQMVVFFPLELLDVEK